MDYQLIRFRIDDLNDFVRSSMLALPDFQRDFVWGPQKVVDLMQSIARQWPIGSLLLLEGPASFACKPLELAPEVEKDSVRYLLLDGQQRITSIFHAIQDISDYVYYVDMRVLTEESLDEDFVFYMRRRAFESKYPTVESRAFNKIVKISELYETESFFDWLHNVEDADYQKVAVKVRRNYIYGLNSGVYAVPATVLPNAIGFDALAKIFEGLNTNAVRLTTSDLLVAANLPKGVNLRSMWSVYQQQDPNIEALDIDLLDILKLCVLRERAFGIEKVKGIKQTDLVKVDPAVYQRQWDQSCAQFSRAISFASQFLGIKGPRFLPSSYNLLGLSFALEINLPARMLVEWWVSVILGETFAQSAHTRMLTEIRRLQEAGGSSEIRLVEPAKQQLEFTTALTKPHAANAYLTRGILSLRLALVRDDEISYYEPYQVSDQLKVTGLSGQLPPSKSTAIGELRISKSIKGRSHLPVGYDRDVSSMSVGEIIDSILGKIQDA